MNLYRLLILFLVLNLPSVSYGQVVYQDVNKTSVYNFLDEMANIHAIELNSFVKPYSRELIATKLNEIKPETLNKRQKKELAFFLKDFNKELKPDKNFDKRYDLFYYKDSLFRFTLNPILGFRYEVNENNYNWHRWVGGEVYGSIGKQVGFYANLRDNSVKNIFQNETFLNRDHGVNAKGSGDFSEMRGGLTYGWKWGSIGLLKDNYVWGNNNFGSNIFSGKTPSFGRLEFKIKPTKWFDFTYFHGWLASEVRDSTRSYVAGARNRNVDVSKFKAANVLTVRALKGLNISLGNSIIYSDKLQPVFFIPFMFFKAVDHTVYAGSGNYGGANTQMFLEISSRNIRSVHLFASVYIDEISISRLTNSDEHSNFVSGKFGAQWSNILNKNVDLYAEYTATNPVTYDHFVSTTTFESNNYNMGHYLRDNAQELAIGLSFKPISQLRFNSTYVIAEKGENYPYTGVGKDGWGLPFLEEVKWKSSSFTTEVTYEMYNDVFFLLSYEYREVGGVDQSLYTHTMFHGITNTFSFGINVGF